jgi:Negative regulator of sigma F
VTVDCNSFAKALAEREPDLELARHAAVCRRCGPVWEVDQALRHSGTRLSAPPIAAALQRELFELRPTKHATSFATRALSVLSAVTASLGLTMFALPRRDLSLATLTGWTPGILLLLLLSGLALFAYRGRTGLGVAPWLRWSVPIVCVAAFELLAGLEARTDGLAAKLDCLFLGSAIAGVLAAVSCSVSRRTALIAPAASGALAGSVAGVTALLCLRVHCPSLLAQHVMIVHVLPLVLAIAGGVYAGKRWLSV